MLQRLETAICLRSSPDLQAVLKIFGERGIKVTHQGAPLDLASRLCASGAAGSLDADQAHHPCITGSSLRVRQ